MQSIIRPVPNVGQGWEPTQAAGASEWLVPGRKGTRFLGSGMSGSTVPVGVVVSGEGGASVAPGAGVLIPVLPAHRKHRPLLILVTGTVWLLSPATHDPFRVFLMLLFS